MLIPESAGISDGGASAASKCLDAAFRRRRKTIAAKPAMARTAMTPITIPAIAPGASEEDEWCVDAITGVVELLAVADATEPVTEEPLVAAWLVAAAVDVAGIVDDDTVCRRSQKM